MNSWTLFFLYLYALSVFLSPGTASVVLLPIFLLTFLSRDMREEYRNRLTTVALVFFGYSLLATVAAVQAYPDLLLHQVKNFVNLNLLWFLPVVILAIALSRHRDAIDRLVLAVISGLLLKILLKLDLRKIAEIIRTEEPFGFVIAHNALGTYAAAGMLIILLLLLKEHGREKPRKSRTLVLIVILAAQLLLLLLSNSRSSILIFVASLAVVAVLYRMKAVREGIKVKRKYLVLATVVFALLVAVFASRVANRFMFEADVWKSIATGQIEEMNLTSEHQYKSSDVRILMWRIAAEKITERPFFGWGPGTSAKLLAPVRDKTGQTIFDFHNIVIELLIQVGIVGFALIVYVNVLILKKLHQAYKSGRVELFSAAYVLFAIFVVYLASLVNMRTNEAIGRGWMAFFLAIAYSWAFQSTPERERDEIGQKARTGVGSQFKWFFRYCRLFGPVAALRLVWFDLLGVEKLLQVRIQGETFWVRSNTSDAQVVRDIYLHSGYGRIELHAPTVIVDAGANIGISAVCFARLYPAARVLAIEPEANNFAVLLKNVSPFPQITPVNAALWSRCTSMEIKNRFTGEWGYTICDTGEKSAKLNQQIACITVDELLANYQLEHIDLLKLDIEGAEREVFASSKGWIERVGVVTVELHDRISADCSRAFYAATKAFSRFEKHGEKITAYRS